MKRPVLFLSSALLAVALAGCGSAESAAPAATPEPTAAPTATAAPEAETDAESVTDTGEPAPDAELSGLAEQIYAAYPVDLMLLETKTVDLTDESWTTYHTGLNAEQAEKADAAVVSESQTGSQAYSLVLLRVKDPADAQEIAEAVLDGADMAKWICVLADEARVAAFGDKVLFVMADSELVDVDALMDAVPQALGVSFDHELAKITTID